YRDRPGLDRNGIALGGLLYLAGYPDRPPVRPGVIVSDYLTGVFNAFAIVSALYERDRRARQSGTPPRGQWVELSLYESILRIMEHTLAAYDRLGMVREREGNRLKNSAPLDNWETRDGMYVCVIAAGGARGHRGGGRPGDRDGAHAGCLPALLSHPGRDPCRGAAARCAQRRGVRRVAGAHRGGARTPRPRRRDLTPRCGPVHEASASRRRAGPYAGAHEIVSFGR